MEAAPRSKTTAAPLPAHVEHVAQHGGQAHLEASTGTRNLSKDESARTSSGRALSSSSTSNSHQSISGTSGDAGAERSTVVRGIFQKLLAEEEKTNNKN